jgi:hypothetical protein
MKFKIPMKGNYLINKTSVTSSIFYTFVSGLILETYVNRSTELPERIA